MTKWIVASLTLVSLIFWFQNCAPGGGGGGSAAGDTTPPATPVIPGTPPGAQGFGAGSIGFYINGVRTSITTSPLDVKVGDKISLESSFPDAQGYKTKFTLFTNCKYDNTIQEWSDSVKLNLEYVVKAGDQTPCTTLNIWVRNTSSTDLWPIPTDVQESLLLNVTN